MSAEDTPISRIVTLDGYHYEAWKTAVFPPEIGPLYCVMGILGEAGELGKVMLDVIARAITLDPKFATPDLIAIEFALAQAVEACTRLEKMKKAARKKEYDLKPMPELTAEEKTRLRSEQGDNLWYQAGAAEVNGYKLSEVAQQNIQKLRERRDAGVIASAGETIEERKASNDES
jgi:hypothetical protein